MKKLQEYWSKVFHRPGCNYLPLWAICTIVGTLDPYMAPYLSLGIVIRVIIDHIRANRPNNPAIAAIRNSPNWVIALIGKNIYFSQAFMDSPQPVKDWFMAHEVAHYNQKHALKQAVLNTVMLLIMANAAVYLHWWMSLLIVVGVSHLIVLLRHHHEFQADLEANKKYGHAAMQSAMAYLYQAGGATNAPIAKLTHPTIVDRLLRADVSYVDSNEFATDMR